MIHIGEQYSAGNKLYWNHRRGHGVCLNSTVDHGHALSQGHQQRSGTFSNLYDFVWRILVIKMLQKTPPKNKREFIFVL